MEVTSMSITKVVSKSGIIYAYESTPHWVPELGQSRPTKKYLGRINPSTGEIIPTSRKSRKAREINDIEMIQTEHRLLDEKEQLKAENSLLKDRIAKVSAQLADVSSRLLAYEKAFDAFAEQVHVINKKKKD